MLAHFHYYVSAVFLIKKFIDSKFMEVLLFPDKFFFLLFWDLNIEGEIESTHAFISVKL